MRWRQPAYGPLTEAIVDSFRQPAGETRACLRQFTASQWRETWFWFDASGLGFYFLRRAEEVDFLSSVDPATIEQLRSKLATNRERSANLFSEFIELNDQLVRQGIVFANLKGFTLTPSSCSAPELRLQLDLDFLVTRAHIGCASAILKERGYELSATTESTWEFKAGRHVSSDFSSPYVKSAYRCVELHLQLNGMGSDRNITDELLNRRIRTKCMGHRIYALSPADQLVSQALHILSHLRSASTRPAWLLEFGSYINARRASPCFWFDVQQIARRNPFIAVAIGVSVLLTGEMFGLGPPSHIRHWAESSVPDGVRAWVECYGRRTVLADFPGTKLYLLLERELAIANVVGATERRPSVFPALRIPKIFRPEPAETARIRTLRWWKQLRYVLFRIRFHVCEGFVYSIEAFRWRRLSSFGQRNTSHFQKADKEKTSW